MPLFDQLGDWIYKTNPINGCKWEDVGVFPYIGASVPVIGQIMRGRPALGRKLNQGVVQ